MSEPFTDTSTYLENIRNPQKIINLQIAYTTPVAIERPVGKYLIKTVGSLSVNEDGAVIIEDWHVETPTDSTLPLTIFYYDEQWSLIFGYTYHELMEMIELSKSKSITLSDLTW